MRPIQIAVFSLTANLFFTYECLAQQHRYFYDSDGNNVGSSMPAGQNTFYYDGQGNNIGSAMKAGRNTYYYDAQGNNVGSSMPSGINNDE
jgi:YD repeat-containing protein